MLKVHHLTGHDRRLPPGLDKGAYRTSPICRLTVFQTLGQGAWNDLQAGERLVLRLAARGGTRGSSIVRAWSGVCPRLIVAASSSQVVLRLASRPAGTSIACFGTSIFCDPPRRSAPSLFPQSANEDLMDQERGQREQQTTIS